VAYPSTKTGNRPAWVGSRRPLSTPINARPAPAPRLWAQEAAAYPTGGRGQAHETTCQGLIRPRSELTAADLPRSAAGSGMARNTACSSRGGALGACGWSGRRWDGSSGRAGRGRSWGSLARQDQAGGGERGSSAIASQRSRHHRKPGGKPAAARSGRCFGPRADTDLQVHSRASGGSGVRCRPLQAVAEAAGGRR